jgi:hypothetical protein
MSSSHRCAKQTFHGENKEKEKENKKEGTKKHQ